MHAWLNEPMHLVHGQLVVFLMLAAGAGTAIGIVVGKLGYRHSESWKFDCALYQLKRDRVRLRDWARELVRRPFKLGERLENGRRGVYRVAPRRTH